MLSGSGRHRRPRQAPAFLVTAGVTSAGVALPLLGVGAAHAVDGETWDAVAECESGGEWTAGTGNGYYGGLQLPLSMWVAYGGEEFADRPDLASRSQQIAVAERVLDDRGARAAFPVCALSSGLTAAHRAERLAEIQETVTPDSGDDASEGRSSGRITDDGDAGRDDGDARADRSAADSAGSDRSDRAADGPSDADERGDADTGGGRSSTTEPADPNGPTDPAADKETADAGETADRGDSGGKHRGSPDPDETERATTPGGGRHAADDPNGEAAEGEDTTEKDGAGTPATGGKDTADAEDAASDATGGKETGSGYEVRPGDSLSAIAGELGLDGGWPALYEANTGTVGENPDHILPGQLLDLENPVPGAS
ncbi:transglycosylase family protein [Streptomyces sp. SM14]|uniref:transglycosylase family protein n=1 Tax=Streptomyces sp. SM14 TaxID=1736045 RepID=UPI000CD50956|nr:transglycosylase family protein [Streptomyces sp. SM14]